MTDDEGTAESIYDEASKEEAEDAAAAAVHPHHHPHDPNLGLVRVRTSSGALAIGSLAGLVMLVGLIALAIAVRGVH